MLLNNLKVTLRSIHRAYALINLAGLALGCGCCLIIVLFVHNELDQDQFHRHGDRIYRIVRVSHDASGNHNIGVTSPPFAAALQTDYPADIEETTRVLPQDALVSTGDKSFTEKDIILADSNFFSFFSYPLVIGSPRTVLAGPSSIVLSTRMAHKYFGSENPVGHHLKLDKAYDVQVTGVFENGQSNSHLRFDFVVSMGLLSNASWFNVWWGNSLFTYVRLREGALPRELQSHFPAFMDKYFGDDFRTMGIRMDIALEPLKDIYFNNTTRYDFVAHGNRDIMVMFAAIAVLILFVSCINFMNLATARASARAKEVGVRKVVGAYRGNLVAQFIGESILFAIIAFLLGLVLVELVLPYFNRFFSLQLSLSRLDLVWVLSLAGGTVLVGFLAGTYPAFVLSSMKPVAVLKRTRPLHGQSLVRKILVVVQFTVSILLIIATIVIQRQMNFVRTTNLGFDRDQLILVRVSNSEIYRHRETFRRELLRDSHITHVSAMSGEPGGFHDDFGFHILGREGADVQMRTVFTDDDYVKTLGLQIVAGRDFARERSGDRAGIILNETAVAALGWTNEEVLGKQMTITLRDSVKRTVIGVVKDFHFTSLRNPMEPLAISQDEDYRVIGIRLTPGDVQHTLASIEQAWNHAAPGFPFEFQFYDQAYDELYRSEEKQLGVFGVFAFIGIVVACLGLFGLSTFAAAQKTKEVGIRKVLGASTPGIVVLLSREFLLLVTASLLIAVPAGYFAMSRWLEHFAYRTHLEWTIFALAGVIALLIALTTLSFQAVRSALANPVDTLRYE